MEYLDYYGLEFDPFQLPVEDVFSNAGGRSQLLEKIEHLVAFSDLNVFVYGQKGIGKTNFLKHLTSAPSAMWRSVYIDVDSEGQCSFDLILSKLLELFDLKLLKNTSTEMVAAELSELIIQQGQNVILLCLDDAHHLTSDLFVQIQELKKIFQQFEIQLKVLFAGEQDGLEQNCPYVEDTSLSYQLFLEPLSLSDVKLYLSTYFNLATRSEKLPLSQNDIKRIFEMSQGVPGKINVITPEYLLQILNQPAKKMNLPVIKVSFGLVALMLLIAVFYYYQSEEGVERVVIADEVIEESSPSLPSSDSVLQKLDRASELLVKDGLNEQENTQVINQESRDNQGEIKIPIETVKNDYQEKIQIEEEVFDEVVAKEKVATSEVAIFEGKQLKDETEAVNELESKKQQVELNLPFEEKSNKSSSFFKDESGYVLQVLGSYQEQNVDDFAGGFPQFQWEKYMRKHNGKDYYVIVIAGFSSKPEAEKAKQSLPAEISKLQPWNRSIESIRPLLID